MNRYILRTSAVWLVVLAIVIVVLVHMRSTHIEPSPSSGEPVLASGPDVQAGNPIPPSSTSSKPLNEPLAPLQLSTDQMKSIGVMVGTAEYQTLADEIRATGTVAVDERLQSYVQVRFSGFLRKVFADATYQYIRKGQPLFTVYSPDLVATEQEYLLAREDQSALRDSSVEGVASGAASLSAAAEERLRQWEIPASELQKLKQTGKPLEDITIDSPVSGYITERLALPNMAVEPSTRLYTVADLSHIWVNAQVFQTDVGRLKPGDSAAISVDAYPGNTFRARVEEILPQVDMTTRTVQVRLALNNPGLKLKPGMFVNVDFRSPLGRQLTIPASAVFQTGTRQLVFVYEDNGTVLPKEVVLGPSSGDQVAVLSGLEPHQRIVTSANFLIDSESQLQAAAGAPAAANSAAAPANSSSQPSATVAFSTEPAPPQKGSNVFHVKLTSANGEAVDGADVTVTFYMPAMPAMGMAAMKTTARLTPAGGGVYQGQGDLGSGGSWQVTITAQKGGRTIAVKQMRVDATGGM